MDDSLSDQYWGRETMERVRGIAAGIFARHGVDFAIAQRAGGWSNATWLAGGLALRISVKEGKESILMETRLARLLPAAVGYPTQVESGKTDGFEWCLSKEISSHCLGDVWSTLDAAAQLTALRQLWEKARAVHSIDTAAASHLARKRAWFNSCDAEEVAAGLMRLEQQGILTAPQADSLHEVLRRFWETLPGAEHVLNHGDLTLDNALWREGQVVALLDFEFALMAPAELDLNTWLKSALGPEDGTAGLPESERAHREQLRQMAVDLARPVIAHPGGKELLLGYAILLELWMLQDWLAHPDGEGPLVQWAPYRRLLSLADGQGGYLAAVGLV